jgi:chromate reductase
MSALIGLAGSLRKGSYNAKLLAAAAREVPAGSSLELASIAGIPLYDGDVEANEGVPAAVRALQERIAAADGLLIVTPEYNFSVPGVLKNALDWLSRPADARARTFRGLPVALAGATPGPGGTIQAHVALLPVLRGLSVLPYFGSLLYVSHAAKVFDADGNVVDEAVKKQIAAHLGGFAAFVDTHKRSR